MPGTSLARAGHLPGYHLPVAVSAAGVAAIVFIFFLQTIGFPFLNWDDADIFVHNPALHAPGFIRWAFTTTYVEHFQPGAWLVWGAVDRAWGLTPTAAHSITVVLHTACAALVLLLGERLGLDRAARVIGALLFALHPLRVEVVAWASAMPYSLALLFALLSTLIFLEPQRTALLTTTSVALFAASLLARPVAFGLPVVLWVLDVRRNRVRRLTPFVVLAVGAVFLESRARVTATFAEVGAGARFTLACTAPFKYLWRTIVPVKLTPLDPLALTPRGDLPLALASAAALGTLTWIAWRWRREFPRSFAAWISYLALLLPAVGLVPSGLQATADRYTYFSAVPLSLWLAAAAVRPSVVSGVRRTSVAASAVVIASLAILSYQQMQYWRSSIALWTRAVDIDPRSDLARYNLASAFAEAGRRDAAVAQYDEVLHLVPDHRDARRNRDLLRAAQLEDEANGLAASGKLDEAIARYREAIGLDPARTHSQAALGMALVQSRRTAEAVEPLRAAIRLGALEPAIPKALAFALVMNGRTREACDVLETAHARFPSDPDVARNRQQLSRECGEGR